MANPRKPYAPRLPAGRRREQLLDEALELIVEAGFAAASIDAVARRAGVARTVVYRTFGDREGMLNALIDRETQRATAQLEATMPALPGDGDPDDLLIGAVRAFLHAVRANAPTWRLVTMALDGVPAELQARVRRDRADVVRTLKSTIDWAVAARGGPSELDSELMAGIALMLGESSAQMVIGDPEHFPAERFIAFTETVIRNFGRGAEDRHAASTTGTRRR